MVVIKLLLIDLICAKTSDRSSADSLSSCKLTINCRLPGMRTQVVRYDVGEILQAFILVV